MKITWFCGPVNTSVTGVHKYSNLLINGLSEKGYQVHVIDIKYRSRSIARYLYQFFIYPIILFQARNSSMVVLYQEDLSFLIMFARLFRIPVAVICHHVPMPTSKMSRVEKIKLLYLRSVFKIIKYANVVITPSEQTKKDIVHNYKLEENKVALVYNAFDFSGDSSRILDFDAKREFFKKNNIIYEGGEKIFLNVGTNEYRKNLFTWLIAFSKLDQQKNIYIQVGKVLDKNARQNECDFVSQGKLNVFYINYVNDVDLQFLYRIADIYVSPSLHEGFGRTVIEAQYYGVLVLASKLPIYDEIMHDTYIDVLEPQNPNSWVYRLAAISEVDPRLYFYARENSRRFLLSSVLESFENVIRVYLKK